MVSAAVRSLGPKNILGNRETKPSHYSLGVCADAFRYQSSGFVLLNRMVAISDTILNSSCLASPRGVKALRKGILVLKEDYSTLSSLNYVRKALRVLLKRRFTALADMGNSLGFPLAPPLVFGPEGNRSVGTRNMVVNYNVNC